MTRVQILESPVAAPGVCCLCGCSHNEDRKYVDFGKQLDWFGAVYFCTICFAEIAMSIGYVPHGKTIAVQEELALLMKKYLALEKKYLTVEQALHAISGSNCSEYSDSVDVPRSPASSVAKSAANAGSSKKSAERNPKADTSTSVEGHSDVLDIADFDQSSSEAKDSA